MRSSTALFALAFLGFADTASAQSIAAPPGNAHYGRSVYATDNPIYSRLNLNPYSTVISPQQYAKPPASVGYGFGTTMIPNTFGSPYAANWNMYPTIPSPVYVQPPHVYYYVVPPPVIIYAK